MVRFVLMESELLEEFEILEMDDSEIGLDQSSALFNSPKSKKIKFKRI
jgi:hypothetical protein